MFHKTKTMPITRKSLSIIVTICRTAPSSIEVPAGTVTSPIQATVIRMRLSAQTEPGGRVEKIKIHRDTMVSILAEADAGMLVTEVCRKHEIAGNTFYNWKKKYGGMGVPEVRRLKELEIENSRLKRMYSDLSLENDVLKELIT